jgi:hypothetical protein
MSCDVKAVGTLELASKEDLDDANESLVDGNDESVGEVRELVKAGTARKRKTLTIRIHGNLTADANVIFQDWLEDVASVATAGHVDTWQESFGDSMFVRLHAGGEEETIKQPFPSS